MNTQSADDGWQTVSRSTQKPAARASESTRGSRMGTVETTRTRMSRLAAESKAKVLGVGDSIGAGDSYLVENILPDDLSEDVFQKVKEEVKWDVMHHRGGNVPRLVAVQGQVSEDGSFPIYRHPADESPPLYSFTSTVSLIREQVEKLVNHPINHVLIQYYRSGKDYISEHSDKTIDIVKGSNIVNVSLGAQRTMTLRQKKEPSQADESEEAEKTSRVSQKIPLPHGSMFVMGLETNKTWLHGINHDNRPLKLKTAEERVEDCGRISLTFRYIGTFLTADQKLIYGQGATGKTREEAKETISGSQESSGLLWAFGRENHESTFDWNRWYGSGYDVLHFQIKDA